MTTAIQKRSIFDAVVFEPLELIKAQPPQLLISIASAYLIAAEAAVLLELPFNILLAIGAEWGYLRGMASAASIETHWKDRLTYANGALVVLYGALFSLRKFGALPSVDQASTMTSPLGAWIMTIIHITCIGAVTVCAMMAHAALLAHEARVKRLAEQEEKDRNQAQLVAEQERNRKWQDANDEIAIEMRRRKAELEIAEEVARRKIQLAIERRNLQPRSVARNQKRNPIIVDGVEYPTIQAAADAHGISRQAMAKRLCKTS